ncbi:MAG: sel1 repeat family protein, partial [Synergistaceae bacterium]|nr:sel1 repeat family protein [Synergistaceae bacterium]
MNRMKLAVFLTLSVFLACGVASPAAASEFDDAKLAAERGAPMPQYMLAQMHETGKGAAKSLTEAVKWYEKAAAQGNTMAQNRLGEMYRDGLGVVKNKQKAIQLFERAAKGGLPQARS